MRPFLFALLLLAPPAAAQTTWHVAAAGTPPGSGTALDPYTQIQSALAAPATVDGDTLLVQPGTYAPIDFLGKAVTVESSGGAAVTAISAGGSGIVATFVSREGPSSVLRGFTLRDGTGVWLTESCAQGDAGGGILCRSSSPTFEDCVVISNGELGDVFSPNVGGGAFLEHASPRFERCEFSANFAVLRGGGVEICGDSAPVFVDCTFSSNTIGLSQGGTLHGGAISGGGFPTPAQVESCTFQWNNGAQGGAVYGNLEVRGSTFTANTGIEGGAAHGVPLLEGCTFTSNEADQDYSPGGPEGTGGAAYGSTLVDCVVQDNRAALGGGVAFCTVVDSRIEDNRTLYELGDFPWHGGGAYESDLEDCLVRDNSTVEGFPDFGFPSLGGGVYGGSAVRCTIRDNTTDQGGGAALADLERCTVVGNTVRSMGAAVSGGTLASSVVWLHGPDSVVRGTVASWSTVEGGWDGTGVLSDDPRFWDPAQHDYRLRPTSPAIDAGDPAEVDPDGSRADQGALPFEPTHVGPPGVYCEAKTTSGGCLPSIGWTGTPTLSGADDFRVRASSVQPNQLGLCFWGLVPDAVPFAGGTRCISGTLARRPIQHSGAVGACQGTYLEWFPHADLQAMVGPYGTFFAQYYFRDPQQPDGTGAGLTDALEVTVAP